MKMRRLEAVVVRRAGFGLVAVALVGGALWMALAGEPLAPAPEVTSLEARPAPAGERRAIDPASTRFDPARLFDIGFAGGLRVDAQTRTRLDALLAGMPADPGPADLERLERALRDGLPFDDAQEAMKLVTSYLAYLGDVKKTLAEQNVPADTLFTRMQALQAQHFDAATAQALFGDTLRSSRFEAQARVVEQDAGLSPEQKQQQLEALRAQFAIDQDDAVAPPVKPDSKAVPH